MDGNDTGSAASSKVFEFFKAADKDKSGFLNKVEFRTAIEGLLKSHQTLFDEISSKKGSKDGSFKLTDATFEDIWNVADVNGTGKVSYLEFLHCFQPEDRGYNIANIDRTSTQISNMRESKVNTMDELRIAMMEQICTIIWSNKQALMKTFQFYDSHQSLAISKDEFTRVLRCLNNTLNNKAPPLTRSQIELLVDHCTVDKKGRIEYKKFLDSLVISDMHTGEIL